MPRSPFSGSRATIEKVATGGVIAGANASGTFGAAGAAGVPDIITPNAITLSIIAFLDPRRAHPRGSDARAR